VNTAGEKLKHQFSRRDGSARRSDRHETLLRRALQRGRSLGHGLPKLQLSDSTGRVALRQFHANAVPKMRCSLHHKRVPELRN
jgi:hypothetical protein